MPLKTDVINKLKNLFSLKVIFKVVLPFSFFLTAAYLLYKINKSFILNVKEFNFTTSLVDSELHLFELTFSSVFIISLLLLHRWYTKHLTSNTFSHINAEFNNLVYIDPLTNTLNKKAFWEDLQNYVKESKNSKAYLLSLDLGGFKRINEVVGYSAGDFVLKKFTSRLEDALKEETSLQYRVGGDEFAVLVTNEHHEYTEDEIKAIAKKLLSIVNEPFIINNETYTVSLNIGIAQYPKDGLSAEDLFKNSDLAVYDSKMHGKNTYAFYSETMGIKIKYKKLMESLLLNALDNDEFYLMFQPKVEYINNEFKLIGAEALLRWNNEKLGEISPVEFIPLAEDMGLMRKIGQWVFEETVKKLSNWNKNSSELIKVAVNLSVHQLSNVHLARDFLQILRTNNVSPKQIIIEITESTMMKDIDGSHSILKELSKCGFDISIDDFGTGYSSLSYLRKLDLNELKIDRSFTKDVLIDNKDRIVISTIINLAQNLGLNVVVEGVENKKQLDWFHDKGKIQVQGYYFSKPLLEEDFLKYWKSIN
jgi:diguanylate cyclase (GGDEF)-like protein